MDGHRGRGPRSPLKSILACSCVTEEPVNARCHMLDLRPSAHVFATMPKVEGFGSAGRRGRS
eukprot:2654099-Alexandrium_andersonii.AAC.1